jgi:hypothetical protein
MEVIMEAKRIIRVLVLDGARASGTDKMFNGLEVIATFEGRNALHYPDPSVGGYRLTQHSLDLARAASPDQFDAVIIGNNEWVGRPKAKQIPPGMRSRTLIVWNHHDPTKETPYREMGFSHFGQRYSHVGECDLGVREFIAQIAAEIARA